MKLWRKFACLLVWFIPAFSYAKCGIEMKIERLSGNEIEIYIKNNTKEPYEIRYHDLPWVFSGQGGIAFQVYIDGRKIPTGRGAGNNGEKIKIWGNSAVSQVSNIDFLKYYYENSEKQRVKIEWSYSIPGDGISDKCRFISGELSPP